MEQQQYKKSRKERRASVIKMEDMVYGKVPPQAREVEEAVLGAIMLEKEAFDEVSELLGAESFYVDAHQRIFRAFTSLIRQSKPIDMLTVIEQLKTNEELDLVGGPYALAKMTNSVVSYANIQIHARIILEKYIKREMIRVSLETLNKAYDDSVDVFDLQDEWEASVFSVTNTTTKENYISIAASAAEVVNKVDRLRASSDSISGVPSGFPSMDRVTFGWQPSDLIILAARPAVGKTAFALNLARNAANNREKKTAVAFFSLEMPATQLTQRVMAAESGVWLEKINRGRMDDGDYNQFIRRGASPMQSMPIFIDDSAALNIFEFRAKARRLVNKNKVGFIIIDYLQLMSGTKGLGGGSREQEISTISRGLKQVAKELNVPIIALSQLSRAVETRKESKMPQLSDLRESGAIEQDADMVMFIYRPEYYEVMNNEMGESTKGETHVRIAKHRNGSLETVKFSANLAIQKFEEWQEPVSNSQPIAGSWKPFKEDDGFGADDKPF